MMKKGILAAVIIGLSVLIYFICGTSDSSDDSKTNLMTSTADNMESSSMAGDGEEPLSSESAEEDEIKSTPENTVSFSVRGDSKTYTFKSVNPFIKIARSQDLTGYVANFANDMTFIRVAEQSTYTQVISMLIPGDVTPGPLSEKAGNFMFQFFGSERGVMYSLDVNYPFTVTIDEWGGPGGRARGTFSGELKAEGSGTVITIQDGRFDAGIQ